MEFIKSKFDNLCLVFLIVLLVAVLLFFAVKLDDKVVAWLEQTITTVLGAYIGLTQAHRIPWPNKTNGNGGNANDVPSKVG